MIELLPGTQCSLHETSVKVVFSRVLFVLSQLINTQRSTLYMYVYNTKSLKVYFCPPVMSFPFLSHSPSFSLTSAREEIRAVSEAAVQGRGGPETGPGHLRGSHCTMAEEVRESTG